MDDLGEFDTPPEEIIRTIDQGEPVEFGDACGQLPPGTWSSSYHPICRLPKGHPDKFHQSRGLRWHTHGHVITWG